ncbi:putative DNA binding domain-containing protein [Pontiellaceae bacterium B1224]|nr:putative DNA binding domain-containing protein [Pontiellaceae bacterium B1224]
MNFDIHMIDDIELLRESVDLECKLAIGRNGQGALPQDFWPTYSSFANTNGGVVLLGVRERKNHFSIEGIENPEKVRKELFDGANNPKTVSSCLVTDAMVSEVLLQGKIILVVDIPRATRKQRPVHLTRNPFDGNTYRRLNEGDRRLPDDEVKRMLAEQVEDSRDDRILTGYDWDDLDIGTFRAYRQVFANREPSHPWNSLEDRAFLRQIGGWRKDRETKVAGITVAGLLMFGEMASIQDEFPNYMVDYQEREEAKAEKRWVDRITLDGKWSGNLYDFYRKVYLKLTAELPVPFNLKKGERKDETPVHEALREALANVIVHADYSDRASVFVVKRPDMFGFRNPGLMRIPVEIALLGGEPDCRNRTLHKMFRFIGVGEQAGTGIPKILHGWQSQHWNPPKLYELVEPYNQTLLELRMIDLFPEQVLAGLRNKFGAAAFDQLEYVERVALALASSEGTVNHARLKAVTTEHPVDLSKMLQHLTTMGMLESTGGRGAIYHVKGEAIPKPEDVFGTTSPNLDHSLPNLDHSSPNLDHSSPNLDHSSPNSSDKRDKDGCLLSEHLNLPVIDDLGQLSDTLRAHLETLADEPREKKKLNRETLIQVILKICEGRFVTLRSLAGLVNREPETLRGQYLRDLVKERKLALAFPTTPTHERQAYTSALNK